MRGGGRAGGHIYRKIQNEINNENIKKESIIQEEVSQGEIRKFIFKYFIMEWKMIVISQIVLFFQTYINIYQPFFTQDFIEAAIEGKMDQLVELVKVFAIQNIFLIISEPLLEIFITKFKKRLEIKIQTDIFKEILSKDVNFFEQTKFTQVQQLALQGSRQVMQLACGDKIFNQLKNIFKTIGHCYFIVYKSFYISLVLLAFCIARGVWNHFSLKWKMVLAKENYQDMMNKDNQFQDTMQNVITVKAFGREVKEINKYKQSLEKIATQSTKIDLQNQKLSVVNDLLSKVQKIIVLYYGSIMFISQQESPKVSTITTFLQYSHSFTSLYSAIKELFGIEDQNMYLMVEAIVKLYRLKSNQGLCEDVFIDVSKSEILNDNPSYSIIMFHSKTKQISYFLNGIKTNYFLHKQQLMFLFQIKDDQKDSKQTETTSEDNQRQLQSSTQQLQSKTNKMGTLLGDIEFDSVQFKYGNRPQDDYVLKSVSFQIKGGEFVAFAGTSGSGKSTIIKLIERFYDATEGAVIIDGQNIKDINLGQLRAQIGLVQQEPILFDTTILQNIVYGVDSYSEETVREICDISGVSEFVFDKERFPQGLNTLVGAKGLMLSGGQKQRVAIARALIKRPKILIFDEATSSLDAESEFQVQQYIDQLVKKRGMTIVVIAHRLSTIVNCDRIYVMKKGEITEQGSHRQLLELNGYYKQLINRQLHNNENTSASSLDDQAKALQDDQSPEKVKRNKQKKQETEPKQTEERQNITPIKSKEYSEKKQKLNKINEQIQQQMIQKSQIIQQMSENLNQPQNTNDLQSMQKDSELSVSFSVDGLSQNQIDDMLKNLKNMIQTQRQSLIENNKKNN